MRSIASEYGETISKDPRRTDLRVNILNHASTMFRLREPREAKRRRRRLIWTVVYPVIRATSTPGLCSARFQTITRNGRAMYISGIFCRAGLALSQGA